MNQGYPAIPAEGTGVGSLVSVSDYERITGDTTNSDQDTIDQAVIEVSQFCNRTLGYGQYTERLFVNRFGNCYPSAPPIDPASATLPAEATVFGAAVYVGTFFTFPTLPIFFGTIPPQLDLTYNGGYLPYNASGSTPSLPPKLMRLICKAAWWISNPNVGLPAYGDLTSISLQGVSIAGTLTPLASWQDDTSLTKALGAYQRREIPAFGN